MRETEVKIINVDRKRVEQRLKEFGAEKVFQGELECHFYKLKGRGRAKTIRLRKAGKKAYLTIKTKIPDDEVKIRDESEIEVSDFCTAKKMLALLGLKKKRATIKSRTSYKLGRARLEFDKYHGNLEYLPEYLEIEAEDSKTVHKCAELLGFSKEDCKPWSVKDIIKNELKKRRTAFHVSR